MGELMSSAKPKFKMREFMTSGINCESKKRGQYIYICISMDLIYL